MSNVITVDDGGLVCFTASRVNMPVS